MLPDIEFERIKNYVQFFDCISKVNVGDGRLTVFFECLNGGSYEGIDLKLIFEWPYIFKMPYFQEGIFSIERANLKEQNVFESNLIEGDEKLFLIENKALDAIFYVLCQGIDICIAGSNYHILNEKELFVD